MLDLDFALALRLLQILSESIPITYVDSVSDMRTTLTAIPLSDIMMSTTCYTTTLSSLKAKGIPGVMKGPVCRLSVNAVPDYSQRPPFHVFLSGGFSACTVSTSHGSLFSG